MSTKKKIKTGDFLDELIGEPLTFGRMIESLRKSDELSQVELAFRMGKKKQYINNVEKGRVAVNLSNFSKSFERDLLQNWVSAGEFEKSPRSFILRMLKEKKTPPRKAETLVKKYIPENRGEAGAYHLLMI